MLKQRAFAFLGLALIATGVLFYKSVIRGLVPFPGDLLVSEYQPWKSVSYLGYNPGSLPNKAQYFDVIRQMYPWKTFTLKTIKSGQFPLWNPHNFSGSPLFANNQSAILYPLNIIFLAFDAEFAWTIFIVLQPLLAIIFTYAYARKINLTPIAAMLSSLAYGISLFMSVFLEYSTIGHVILWLPLGLWSIENFLSTGYQRYSCALIIAVAAAALAGHLQMFVVSLLVTIIYGIWRARQKNITTIHIVSYLLTPIAAAILLASTQLFPTFELLSQSARAPHDQKKLQQTLLIQPAQILMAFSPDIFGNPVNRNYAFSDSYPGRALYTGFLPLILALYAFWQARKFRQTIFFSISALLLLTFTVRSPLSETLYQSNLPVVTASSPGNMIFAYSFAIAILSGIGLDTLRKSIAKHTTRNYLMLIIAVLTIITLIWRLGLIPVSPNNLGYFFGLSMLAFILLVIYGRLPQFRTVISCLIVLMTFTDLTYFFHKFNPFVSRGLMYPNTNIEKFLKSTTELTRIWGYGEAQWQANTETQTGLYSPNGYDPLYPRRYGELIHSTKDGNLLFKFSESTRSDAQVAPGYGELEMSKNSARKKILRLLGVKYILDKIASGTSQKTFPTAEYRILTEIDDWRVYEDLLVLPRTFIVHQYQTFAAKEQFTQAFFDTGFDPGKIILLEKNPPIDPAPATGPESAEITRYSPNSLEISVLATSPGLIFLSDTMFPGWTAYVDGQKTELLRANYAFRAVAVRPGSHRITMEYKPVSFYLGLILSMMSGSITILCFLWKRKTF